MVSFSYVIKDEQGIHARPAGLLVKAASGLESKIMLEKGGKKGDAKKIFGIMSLAAKKGDEIQVTVEGTKEEADAEIIRKFLEENL